MSTSEIVIEESGPVRDDVTASYDRPVGDDDLPAEVFAELGRVTWAAILLEDYTESLCSIIQPADPRTDKRSVGRKIKDAQQVLRGWPVSSPTRDAAATWLERARAVIERRNAALHATPVVLSLRGHPDDGQQYLGEMPRAGRSYRQWPLRVETLSELRSVLIDARSGWRELAIAVHTEGRWRGESSATTDPVG